MSGKPTQHMQNGSRFPATRLRRSRMQAFSRAMMQESLLAAQHLIWPLFVMDGTADDQPVPAMPGVYRHCIRRLVEQAGEAVSLGIPAIAIFPYLDSKLKDAEGSEAGNPENLVCRAVAAVKSAYPSLGIITDVALDPFTDHGHDGVIRPVALPRGDGDEHRVENDETVERLCIQALVQAQAGADIIAPSDMMDGRVAAIRKTLDENGFADVIILSYAAKYASAFYGPFRAAVGAGQTSLVKGKASYQMDPANSDEAIREIALDIAEGADWVMVKPGMPYLDIIQRASVAFDVPVFAYQVSGEYAMIEAAAATGSLDGGRAMVESLLALRRAGARGILTYYAPRVATILRQGALS